MSTSRSWAKIEFPVRLIDDEIREKLGENYEVKFNEDGTLKEWHGADIKVESGIFTLEDSEARYGEFEDLERLLEGKGIPFDRESGMDFNRPPVRKVFRPKREPVEPVDHAEYPHISQGKMLWAPHKYILVSIPLNSEGEEVVSVKTIREMLTGEMSWASKVTSVFACFALYFPAYPPLTDWVKEG